MYTKAYVHHTCSFRHMYICTPNCDPQHMSYSLSHALTHVRLPHNHTYTHTHNHTHIVIVAQFYTTPTCTQVRMQRAFHTRASGMKMKRQDDLQVCAIHFPALLPPGAILLIRPAIITTTVSLPLSILQSILRLSLPLCHYHCHYHCPSCNPSCDCHYHCATTTVTTTVSLPLCHYHPAIVTPTFNTTVTTILRLSLPLCHYHCHYHAAMVTTTVWYTTGIPEVEQICIFIFSFFEVDLVPSWTFE